MPIVRFSGGEARRRARVDRTRIRSTKERDIARHAAEDGTETDAFDFSRAARRGGLRAVRPIDVSRIRGKTGLSQDRFAKAFRISPHTLRNWEQGRRVPEGPARALLLAIARDPKAVMRALDI